MITLERYKQIAEKLITKKADWFTEEHFNSEIKESFDEYHSDMAYHGGFTAESWILYYYEDGVVDEDKYCLFEVG